ncbi:hypothetical protein M404DRAFT_25033 [Pisolithus tinctorius Marx 270]|uniref:Uncharacterized protein n=1 Tax=Pisolithus tinctorius Marx 270 TaxID=870435 RepID=A0A0C3K819_PISTI|nr:hypothetical protein M404DRAFT_25033 [Pisolithus tinctorius Marx 270]
MSTSRPTTTANNNSEGWAMIDWTQVFDDAIKYDTNDKEEMMRAKAKERKWHKVAEQAWWEEQAWLEAKRVEREKAEAKRAAWEAKQERAHEKCRAKEEKEAERKCKAEAKAGAGGSKASEVKKVIMDPSCTCCAWAQVVCKFLVDSNKKRVACMHCNQSKGKCQWPGDGKDTEASPKAATKADKGKKQKADEESPEPGPSQKKWVKLKPTKVLEINKPEASGSGVRKAGMGYPLGLEEKLEHLINTAGMIANNLVGLFELQEAVVKNSGHIADMLKAIIEESYSFRVVVTPSDLGSSELDSDELCEEAAWLQAKAKGEEEEEAKGEDNPMAKAK